MKIIFLGLTGIHQTLIAAYYYLGYEPESDFINISGFADLDQEISGYPIYVGNDQFKNMVYALGCETDILMVKKTIKELADILGSERDQIIVLPISIPGEKLLMMLTKIAILTGAGNWYSFLCRFIIKRNLSHIFTQAKIHTSAASKN